jgi:hypothetical protein
MASKVPSKAPGKTTKPRSADSAAPANRKPVATPTTHKTKAASALEAPPNRVARSPAAPAPGTGKARPLFVPRGLTSNDEHDVLMSHGGGGTGFGRCGGRLLSSKLEQQVCHKLGIAGVVHSHSPRHYEVRYQEGQVAAYAPMVVLRSRGREGKAVVIEAVEDAKSPMLRKITAFRSQYGAEFYVILVASDEVLDEVPLAAYDESCSVVNVNTLVARLAE